MVILYKYIGLHVYIHSSDKQSYKYDIAEAPLTLLASERFKPLEGFYKINFNEMSVPHVRCHFLSKSEDDLLYSISTFEEISSTVAVLLINPSENLTLDDHFVKQLPADFQISIPVYCTSSENGHHIANYTSESYYDCCFMLYEQHNKSSKRNNLNLII